MRYNTRKVKEYAGVIALMQLLKSRPRTAESVVLLRAEEITPNPLQPRRIFDPEGLRSLADSIRRYGILNPLSVRRRQGRYELVAGERRLRAARLAGLEEVPCIVLEVDSADSAMLALVENLQRCDLDCVEQAQGIARLIRQFGLSQEECARRLGMSQSAVANKLRLLKLPEDVLSRLRAAGLSERHGRALLRLPDEQTRREALRHIVDQSMTVAAAERYIDGLLERREPPPASGARARFILKDVRVFLNSLRHSVELMRRGGVDVEVAEEQTDDALRITIHIKR